MGEDHLDNYNVNILKRAVHLGVYEVAALKLLTHDKSIPYFDYIAKIKPNELAKTVKLADLAHNSDRSRLESTTSKDEKRLKKYEKAINILNGLDNGNAD